jgi:hypothetical protein
MKQRGRPKIYSDEDRRLKLILHNIEGRCNNSRTNKFVHYGGKGIQNHLSFADLQRLWQRDRALEMKQPSIDRLDSTKNYFVDNCRFIEFDENRQNAKHLAKFECQRCNNRTNSSDHICGKCKQRKPCRNCGAEDKKSHSSSYCDRCFLVDRGPCVTCGTRVIVTHGQLSNSRYSQQTFCNKKCFGSWLSRWRERRAPSCQQK